MNPTQTTQLAIAELVFQNYDFGPGVTAVDSSGWEHSSPGNVYTRPIFVEVEDTNDKPSTRLTLTVAFNPNTSDLSGAYASDSKGQIWGRFNRDELRTAIAELKSTVEINEGTRTIADALFNAMDFGAGVSLDKLGPWRRPNNGYTAQRDVQVQIADRPPSHSKETLTVFVSILGVDVKAAVAVDANKQYRTSLNDREIAGVMSNLKNPAAAPTQQTAASPFAPKVSTPTLALQMDVGEVFANPEFVAWLNNGNPKFSWHQGGEPGDYSDVVVCVDPSLSGEGSDSDMPEAVWEMILDECRKHFGPTNGHHIMVRLTNMAPADEDLDDDAASDAPKMNG